MLEGISEEAERFGRPNQKSLIEELEAGNQTTNWMLSDLRNGTLQLHDIQAQAVVCFALFNGKKDMFHRIL